MENYSQGGTTVAVHSFDNYCVWYVVIWIYRWRKCEQVAGTL